ncbi:MAG: GNAT family N-acetyltransferase [bacterium]|nr:GNAT family N-acetyltransferase [bacterium]
MIKTRKATLKDLPQIEKLWKDFMAEHNKAVLHKNKKLKTYAVKGAYAVNSYRKFVRGHIKSRNGALVIAYFNGEVAGYTLFFLKDEIPLYRHIKKYGYIADLYVIKRFRKKKIGSELIKEAIGWFRKKKMKHIAVGTFCDNKFARFVYKKKGFFEYKIELRKEL